MLGYLSPSKAFRSKISCCAIAPGQKSHLQVAPIPGPRQRSPPSRFERLTSLKPPALPGDIYLLPRLEPKPVSGLLRPVST